MNSHLIVCPLKENNNKIKAYLTFEKVGDKIRLSLVSINNCGESDPFSANMIS